MTTKPPPGTPPGSLRSVAESASADAMASAEAAVERRMKRVMAFDARLSALKSLGTPAGQDAAGRLARQRPELDDEVRNLVQLAGEVSALADNLRGRSAIDSQELNTMRIELESLRHDANKAQRALEETSARAAELLAALAAKDSTIAQLEQKVRDLQAALEAASPEAPMEIDVDLDGGVEIEEAGLPVPAGRPTANPLVEGLPRLEKEKYAGRASVRIRELLLDQPYRVLDLVDVTGLPHHEVMDCVESFVALGVARIVEDG